MLVKTYAAALQSIQARTVTIEVSCTRGSYFQLVGLPDTAIKESQDRIISAIESSGYKFPGKRIVINMSPADLRKEGAAYDLPLAIGLLAADGQIPLRSTRALYDHGRTLPRWSGSPYPWSPTHSHPSPKRRLPRLHSSRSQCSGGCRRQ